jgi:hypothetical protein
LHSLVISRTHGLYHNWQLIANELGHNLNNKQCCQRWKCIKHRYIVNKKKRTISDISGNNNTSDNKEKRNNDHLFPSPLHSVVVHQAVDKNNHLLNHESHQPVTAEEVPVMIGQKHSRKYDVNVEKAFFNQKRKKEPHEIRTKWTPEMVRDSIHIMIISSVLFFSFYSIL